ncbi:MAG: hypothetical protein OXQ29_00740 [Rhodospirillaceae bacterium]|nr:hypothetical protein [Rhodospirillaceae bacterium]
MGSSYFLNLQRSIIKIAGHRITEWADQSDAFMLPTIESLVVTQGPGGDRVFSDTGNRGGPVTIKVMPAGKDAKHLGLIAEKQRRGNPIIITGVAILDYGAAGKETVHLRGGGLISFPSGPTLGNAAPSHLEYVIDFADLERDLTELNPAAAEAVTATV